MEWKMFLRTNGRWSIGHLCDEYNCCACGISYSKEEYTKIKVIGGIPPKISCDVCRVREMLIKNKRGEYENARKYPIIYGDPTPFSPQGIVMSERDIMNIKGVKIIDIENYSERIVDKRVFENPDIEPLWLDDISLEKQIQDHRDKREYALISAIKKIKPECNKNNILNYAKNVQKIISNNDPIREKYYYMISENEKIFLMETYHIIEQTTDGYVCKYYIKTI